uniref:Uncharacterized protein n=1 Tax=Sphaerodactylus townsendi TaxID=933632 RepID=A0ACB8F5Y8_9SAUR
MLSGLIFHTTDSGMSGSEQLRASYRRAPARAPRHGDLPGDRWPRHHRHPALRGQFAAREAAGRASSARSPGGSPGKAAATPTLLLAYLLGLAKCTVRRGLPDLCNGAWSIFPSCPYKLIARFPVDGTPEPQLPASRSAC